mgnify:FL=1
MTTRYEDRPHWRRQGNLAAYYRRTTTLSLMADRQDRFVDLIPGKFRKSRQQRLTNADIRNRRAMRAANRNHNRTLDLIAIERGLEDFLAPGLTDLIEFESIMGLPDASDVREGFEELDNEEVYGHDFWTYEPVDHPAGTYVRGCGCSDCIPPLAMSLAPDAMSEFTFDVVTMMAGHTPVYQQQMSQDLVMAALMNADDVIVFDDGFHPIDDVSDSFIVKRDEMVNHLPWPQDVRRKDIFSMAMGLVAQPNLIDVTQRDEIDRLALDLIGRSVLTPLYTPEPATYLGRWSGPFWLDSNETMLFDLYADATGYSLRFSDRAEDIYTAGPDAAMSPVMAFQAAARRYERKLAQDVGLSHP